MTAFEVMSSHHLAIQPNAFPALWVWHMTTNTWQARAILQQPYSVPPKSQAQQSTNPELSWQKMTLSTHAQLVLDLNVIIIALFGSKQGQSLLTSAFKRQCSFKCALPFLVSSSISSSCLQLVWSGIQRMGDVIVPYWMIPFLKPLRSTGKESVAQSILQPGSCATSIASGNLADLVISISDAYSNKIL